MAEQNLTPATQLSSEEVLDAQEIEGLLDRLAAEIHSAFADEPNLSLVGIRRRGDVLARRLQPRLGELFGTEPAYGALDITLYRDDFDSLAEHPVVGDTHIPFPVNEATVILVDDVLYTGRTVRAALDELLDLGRPTRIALAVLIDRGWRELPIAADFVGRVVSTEHDDDVQVLVHEIDERDAVALVRHQDDE
jgi:pyrimidine operon attenuation protein / uracil phosphoribosyltransferase